VGDKITIAQARVRRTDPRWRRRHTQADAVGIVLVGLLVAVPPVAAALWPRLGLAVVALLLVGAAAGLGWRGPRVGLERRVALLVIVPGANLVALVPAVWRAAHLHLQRWQGPLQPGWDDSTWLAVAAVAGLLWATAAGGVVWTLA
jgi:hypothetical protein